MFILFGDNLTPVAVFDTNEQLSAYVNSLVAFGTSEIDPVLKAQSVLAGQVDHQSQSISSVWESNPDWKNTLNKAKLCPRNPACAPASSLALQAEKVKMQTKHDEAVAEIARIDALLGA
jgi:deoxyribose-phosphate aldolase